MENVVHGYKVFNPDWTCRGKQYTCPGKFEETGELATCKHGMHFCKKAIDCFNYYEFNPNNKVAEVIAYGNIIEGGDKCCTDKLEIVREIPWTEVLELVNLGKSCTGRSNTGDCNTGNRNTGDYNTGDCNTGNWNTGDCNTGDCNTGDCNTGDWNKSSYNAGCFNTHELPIYLFNKLSSWTIQDWMMSDARTLLYSIPQSVAKWVSEEEMTDEEKEEFPTYKTTGGYLKVLDNSDCNTLWWKALSDAKKQIILSIPNFDKEIFKEITGIDVDAK